MDKINFENLPSTNTPITADNLNQVQDNVDNSKVEKSGDTMTGALVLENKSEFSGVSKTRTVDGIDYTASFGVGADATASFEIKKDGTVLGRLDITSDGKIRNNKTGKYLVEENDTGWVDLTLESGVAVSSLSGINQTPQYRKIGNHVYIRGHISATWDGTNIIKIAALPFIPPKNIYKFTTLQGASIARIYADTYGYLTLEWIKYIPDGANQTAEKAWISLDMDFWID